MTGYDQFDIVLTTEQVISCTGVTLGALKDYLKHGFIIPTVASTGKRQRSYYSFKDAVLIRLIKELSNNQLPRKFIAPIAKGLSLIKINNEDPLIEGDSFQDPLSLSFSPLKGKSGKSITDYKQIAVKLINCGEFYKVGYLYKVKDGDGRQSDNFLYKLIRDKDLKPINSFELSEEMQTRLDETLYPYNLSMSFTISITVLHFEVRQALSTKIGFVGV
jgi:hypothetical protein